MNELLAEDRVNEEVREILKKHNSETEGATKLYKETFELTKQKIVKREKSHSMMLSEEKITHLTHVLLQGLINRNLIGLNDEEGKIRREIKRIVVNELKIGEDIDSARRKSRNPFQGNYPRGVLSGKCYTKIFQRRGDKEGQGFWIKRLSLALSCLNLGWPPERFPCNNACPVVLVQHSDSHRIFDTPFRI